MRKIAQYVVPLIRVQHTIYLRNWWNPSLGVTLQLVRNPSIHTNLLWLTVDAVALPASDAARSGG